MVVAAIMIVALIYPISNRVPESDGYGGVSESYEFMGLGDDHYKNASSDFYNTIKAGLTRYELQQILPSAFVYHGLKLLSIEPTNQAIVTSFLILNSAIAIITAYLWGLVADELKIRYTGKWIGFIALFINFPIIKMAPYYPTLNDVSAYMLGLMMLFCYLTQRKMWLVFSTILGAFIWPIALYLGSFLLLFPKHAIISEGEKTAPRKLNFIVAGMLSLLLLIGYLALHFQDKLNAPSKLIIPFEPALGLSIIVAVLYIFITTAIIFNNSIFYTPRFYKNLRLRKNVILGLSVFLGVSALQILISEQSGISVLGWGRIFLSSSVILPGISTVSHVVYYGPFFVLFLVFLKPLAKVIHQHGIGIPLMVVFSIMISLFGEPRLFIIFYPIWVPFLIKVIDNLSLKFIRVLPLLMYAIFFTFLRALINPDGHLKDAFLSGFGLWLDYKQYSFYIVLVVILFVGVFFLFNDLKPSWIETKSKVVEKYKKKVSGWMTLHVNLAMVVAALALVILFYTSSERIPVYDGLGWDGVRFARTARNFYDIFTEGTSKYTLRILPSAVVFYSLSSLNIQPTNSAIITGFLILNGFLTCIMAYIWGLVSDLLKLGYRGKWFGFMGLFVNYAVLKMGNYFPVLTDISAFAIGMLMIYFYLSGKEFWLAFVTLLGSFTWPTALYMGILLLLFPKRAAESVDDSPAPFRLNILVGILASICYIVGIIFLNSQNKLYFGFETIIPINSQLLLLSVGINVAFIFFSLKSLLNHEMIFKFINYTKTILGKNLLLVIGVFLINNFANTIIKTEMVGDFTTIIKQVTSSSLLQPGIFIVAHTIYFGPIVLFCFLCWKSFTKMVYKFGLGLIFAISVGLMLSLLSESRGHMLLLPMLIPFFALIVDQKPWRGIHFVLLAGLSLLLSKAWLPFNNMYNPIELYFSQIGPWMKPNPYIINLVTVVILIQIILRVFPLNSIKINKFLKG
jgi:hypothetical protein